MAGTTTPNITKNTEVASGTGRSVGTLAGMTTVNLGGRTGMTMIMIHVPGKVTTRITITCTIMDTLRLSSVFL